MLIIRISQLQVCLDLLQSFAHLVRDKSYFLALSISSHLGFPYFVIVHHYCLAIAGQCGAGRKSSGSAEIAQ